MIGRNKLTATKRNYGVSVVAKGKDRIPRLAQRVTIMWPERVALVSALFIAVVMLFIWGLLAVCAESTRDERLNAAAFHWFVYSECWLVLPPWLVLRAISFILNTRRRRPPHL